MSYSHVLIDGATLHAAAATFQRMSKQQRIRPINILALSALVDAFILFENVVADDKAYKYFSEHVPADWLVHFDKVITTVDTRSVSFDDGVGDFLSSDETFWALNVLLKTEMKLDIRKHYMTYAGKDFGIRDVESKALIDIDNILKEKWDWDYNHPNTDHIDIIHACWRGVQYSEFCSQNGYSYFPHELRGSFLDIYASLSGKAHPVAYVRKIVDKARKALHEDRLKHVKDKGDIFPVDKEALYFWRSLKMPLFSAKVFQKSKTIYDLFDVAGRMRAEAKEFREKCMLIDSALSRDEFHRVEDLYNEFASLFDSFPSTKETAQLNWSISLSFPWRITVGVGGSVKRSKRHLNFIRDIFTARAIPFTIKADIARLFGQDNMHFFEAQLDLIE